MNNFIHAINGFYTNDVYYGDTDGIYFEIEQWKKLYKAGLLRKTLI